MSTTTDPALARLIERVHEASRLGACLEIHGGRSKSFYGESISGAALDTRELRGISSYEPTELVVTVRAGTPLSELEAALNEHGQCLAFDPPHFGDASSGTVGGMVAAGIAGPARASAGSVRDFVLGATLLNGRGEVLTFGGQVMKNVAGYDVSRLLAGSLGILGVICEVSLKVLPVAAATETVCFECDECDAVTRLNRWTATALPLQASAWYNERLFIRLAGAKAAVDSARARLRDECNVEAIEPARAKYFWNDVRDHRHEFFSAIPTGPAYDEALWRLSVPANAAQLKLTGKQLIEWGGAQRWWRTTASPSLIRDAATRAGGHATLFRASDKSAGVFTPLTPPLERIHRELKKAFDPQRSFNRGRLYAYL